MKPVLTLPEVQVEIDVGILNAEDAQTLGEVRVQQKLSLPTLCDLTFFEPREAFVDNASSFIGSPMNVRIGDQTEPVFFGDVTAVEFTYEPSRGRVMRIRGYDRLHRLRRRRPVRAHVQVSLTDLARELLSEDGISVHAAESGPLWQRIVQYRQSDFDLLAEFAQRCGLYFTLRMDVLEILTLEGLGEPLPLGLGESLLETRIEVNGDSACASVTTSGWNPWTVIQHVGSATSARLGRSPRADVDPGRLGGNGELILVNEPVQDDDQAESLAQARLDALVSRDITLWGTAQGDVRLRPGTLVQIDGLAASLSGTYTLSAVTHTIDKERGFVSELSTAVPNARLRNVGASLVLGNVSSVDDPDSLGRVKVSLPACEDVETDWMGVVSVGAGPGKGLVATPDVGDHVVVLCTHEDLAQGIVLGGLYGIEGPPDTGVEGGKVKRFTLRTREGQQICLDDEGTSIRIENHDGSFLELRKDRVVLHSQVPLEIEAPGQAITIGGKSIDFQKR